MKAEDRAWRQGFACAVAIAVRAYEEHAAEVIMEQGNFKYTDFKKAGADEHDLEAIRKLTKEAPK